MILVSILSNFDSNILPLFFHHSEDIRMHVLLSDTSKLDQKHAAKIQAGFKRFCDYHDLSPQLLEIHFDEDNMESIQNVLHRVMTLAKRGERLSLNSSGALASTQAIMQPLLFELGGDIIAYDRFDNTCNVVSQAKMHKEVVSPMTIDEHLILKDIDFTYPDESELLTRKEVVLQLMKDGRRYGAFKNAFAQRRSLQSYGDILKLLEGIGKSDDQFYITGTLFEEYCYWLIRDLRFDDIHLGTVVNYDPHHRNSYKNEFDILCIKDNHLNIIECKFRNYVDGEELVYQYDSIIDLLDADGRVLIVAVGGDKRHHTHGHQFRDATKYRAQENQIDIYQEKVLDPVKFREKVEHFFIKSI